MTQQILSHWIAPFTQRLPNGDQMAFCGEFVAEHQYAPTPTCPACIDAMQADAEDLEALRADLIASLTVTAKTVLG